MTGTPFDDGHVDEAGAEMLRERFDVAVGSLSLEIGRLVADGMSEGRGAVRRRRIASGIAAAAVAIVAVGSISYASQSDLFGKGDHAANNNQLEQLEPATSRGLAAALISHTDDLGTPFAVGGTSTPSSDSSTTVISGQVAYKLSADTGVEIDVFATSDLSQVDRSACGGVSGASSFEVCRSFTLPNGDTAWYVVYESDVVSGTDQQVALSAVITIRDDEAVAVLQTMSGTTDFVLDQNALATIAADPAIGLSTTSTFNTAGQDIQGFRSDGLTTQSQSSGSGTASPPTVETQPAQPRGTSDSRSATSN